MSLPRRPDIYMDLKVLSVLMDALLFVAELEDRALNKTKVTANSKSLSCRPQAADCAAPRVGAKGGTNSCT